MTTEHVSPAARKPLRVWPGVTAAVLGVLVTLLLPVIAPGRGMLSILGVAGGALVILFWWLLFSRASWGERLSALGLIAIALIATRFVADESMTSFGAVLFFVIGVPLLLFALLIWAVITRAFTAGRRRAWLLPVIALSSLLLATLRVDGATASRGLNFGWRWTPTAEERMLAAASEGSVDLAPDRGAPTEATDADPSNEVVEPAPTSLPASDSHEPAPPAAPRHVPEWPGFRGSNRDGIVHGIRIATDWSTAPPVEMWRRPVGPGWSSFAIDGDRFYTQEQLGEEELVTCYSLDKGERIWTHRDPGRFWEAAGGAGPRATPTLHEGRVYTVGANGVINALDARDGSVVWSRNLAADAQKKVPDWGFAGSPLVVGDALIIAAAGKPVSYDLATGDLRWIGPKGGGYSSAQLATIDGVEQIVILNGVGVVSVDPREGKELWKYDWPGDGIVQPGVMADGSVLVGGANSGMGGGDPGVRRLAIKRAPGEWSPERGTAGWTVEERWTSNGLKPFFNDFVLHEGHAYGFDGSPLAAVDLETGERKWKGGRYGNGQLILLADQDLLLVLSEKGELALVDASPGQYNERARFKAIEGKTWNHPAIARDVVLVRNAEEMAAFRVRLADG